MESIQHPEDIILALTPDEAEIICRALAAKAVLYAPKDADYAQQIRMLRGRILAIQDLQSIQPRRREGAQTT